ncbi:MAG: hypothetical protein RLY16_872, partial [Bacteroidota bacterium]
KRNKEQTCKPHYHFFSDRRIEEGFESHNEVYLKRQRKSTSVINIIIKLLKKYFY